MKLEEKGKPGMKGQIPVVVLPTIVGAGWDELNAARYEINDFVVAAKDIVLQKDGQVVTPQGTFRLTPFAATGFAWCSKTPDRACITDRAAENITKAFHQYGNKEWLLRVTDGGSITAITSPNFVPLPNYTIIDGLQKLKQVVTIGSFKISPWETGINIRLNKEMKVAGEKYYAGTRIKNGEHGKAAFQALGRMERLVCLNGATMQWGQVVDVYKKHVGEWEDFDIAAIVRDISDRAIATSGFFEHLEKLTMNEKKKTDVLKRVVSIGALGSKQAKALNDSYVAQRALAPQRKGETMYDIFNAVTGMKDYFPKSVFEWEELGGKILQGPNNFYDEN